MSVLKQFFDYLNKKYEEGEDGDKKILIDNAIALRRAVGVLGISLPVIVWLTVYLQSKTCEVLPSLSHYYYTFANNVFTAILGLIAFFLIIYKGPKRIDFWVSTIAAVGLFMVICFPCNLDCGFPNYNAETCYVKKVEEVCNGRTYSTKVIINNLPCCPLRDTLHYIGAVIFFVSIVFMALFLFPYRFVGTYKSERNKRIRNRIYRTCGSIMLICLLLMALKFMNKYPVNWDKLYESKSLTFWFESIAILAFGIAWLVKGNTIFSEPFQKAACVTFQDQTQKRVVK